ncbi:uncharacterized protein LOC144905898 [Branchiostoma floridae x Branchiostoma belcheri]
MPDNRTILSILLVGTFCTCVCAVAPDAWGGVLPPEMAGDPAVLTRKQWVPERRNTVGRGTDNPCSLPSAMRPPACDWWIVHRYARSNGSTEPRQDRDNIDTRRSPLALSYLLGLPRTFTSRRPAAQRPVYFRRGVWSPRTETGVDFAE